jgi:hypothetical protein
VLGTQVIATRKVSMSERRIGKWILGEKIGKGGQSSVFEARSSEGEPWRALKLISAVSPKKRQRFEFSFAVSTVQTLSQRREILVGFNIKLRSR